MATANKADTNTGMNLLFDDSNYTTGLMDDVDLTITASTFEEWDMKGKAHLYGGNVCAWHLTVEDGDGLASEQYYSVGSIDKFVPTNDGSWFKSIGGKGPNKTSGAALIAQAIRGCKGVPKDAFAEPGEV